MYEVGLYTIIEEGAKIGENTKILTHSYIYKNVSIGKNCFVGHHVTIRSNSIIGDHTQIGSYNQIEGDLFIGENVKFHSDVHICKGSRVGNRVFIAPRTTLLNTLHPLCPKVDSCIKAPVIEDDVKIGANCTISPGVTVGKGSLIGSATNVISDVPPFSLVVGNPGKIIKDVRDITCPFGLIDKPYGDLENV
jgi:acetyltransferase-like isoleucine patch superfamily enzyme